MTELDNRGLMPPEPMMRILTAITEAQPGSTVAVLMDREPFLLYPELERRGCTWTFEADEWHFRLTINVPSP